MRATQRREGRSIAFDAYMVQTLLDGTEAMCQPSFQYGVLENAFGDIAPQPLLDGTEAMVEVLYHQIHFQEPHIEKRADTGQTSFNV